MNTVSTRHRLAERQRPEDGRANWTQRKDHAPYPAKVVDQSDSGIGLLMDTVAPPQAGSSIHIRLHRSPVTRRARVVRVHEEEGCVRIGCRWISSGARNNRKGQRRRPHRRSRGHARRR